MSMVAFRRADEALGTRGIKRHFKHSQGPKKPSARFAQKSEKPFGADEFHPLRRPRFKTRNEIDGAPEAVGAVNAHGSHGSGIVVDPILLLRRSETYHYMMGAGVSNAFENLFV